MTRDLNRKSLLSSPTLKGGYQQRSGLPLLSIQNEEAAVDLPLVNQLRDELPPDAVACSNTGNSCAKAARLRLHRPPTCS